MKIEGLLFTLIGLIMIPFVFMLKLNRNHFSVKQCLGIILMITFPFIVVEILFLISHYETKKHSLQ